MTKKMIVILGVVLVGSIIALVAMGSPGSSTPKVSAKDSFCSYASRANGSELVAWYRADPTGATFAANGYVNISTPKAIRPATVRLVDGFKSHHIDLAAARQIDVWVAANCH